MKIFNPMSYYSEKNFILPVLQLAGDTFSRGVKIGCTFQKQIHTVLKKDQAFRQNLEYDHLHPEWIQNLSQFVPSMYKEYTEEIRGIADGAKVSFHDLLIHNFRHTFPPKPQHECTTVIFFSQNQIIFCHNEDCSLPIAQNSYILDIISPIGSRFLAFTYAGSLSGNAWGFNSHGIAFSCNALPNHHPQLGIPRIILDRALFEAKCVDEVKEILKSNVPRSGVFSYNVVSQKEMQAMNIEVDGNSCCVTPIDDRYIHTNHYISAAFRHYPLPDKKNSTSLQRYQRGCELLDQGEKSISHAKRILSDPKIIMKHQVFPDEDIIVTANTACFSITPEDITLEVFLPHDFTKPCYQFTLVDLQK